MTALTDSPGYRRFIKGRNLALEQIFQKYNELINRTIDTLKRETVIIVGAYYDNGGISLTGASQLEHNINTLFFRSSIRIAALIASMRVQVYVLSKVGQAIAISLTTQKPTQPKVLKDLLTQKSMRDFSNGGSLHGRVGAHLNKVKRRVFDAIEIQHIVSAPKEDMLIAVVDAFPKPRKIRSPLKKLAGQKKVEADRPDDWMKLGKISADFWSYIDPILWKSIVDDYEQQLPDRTADQRVIGVPEESAAHREDDESYGWIVEQEAANDFVELVREGEIEAAREAGITDFTWIAILDNKTCSECCEWRDGLTTSEIEAKLDGARKDDECQAKVPPAHFNCRCDIAPMTDAMPKDLQKDLGDFETWLSPEAPLRRR